MPKQVSYRRRDFILVIKKQILFIALLSFNCSNLTLNNPCDPSSKVYSANLVLQLVTSERSTICEFKIKNNFATAPVLPCNTCRMFVTSVPFSGNLGGVSGADSKCNADSNKPTTGIYKAFLSDSIARWACTTTNCSGGNSEHLNWVMQANKTYIRSADSIVIGTTNNNGLLLVQSNAVNTASVTTWLGFNSGWTTEPSLHCGDWKDGSNASVGTLKDQSTSPIIGASSNLCDNNHSLVCVEQ